VTQRATWSATAAHLTALHRAPLDDGRRDGRAGLAPKSVRNIHGVLHAALRDAVRWGYLPRNVAVAADLPKGITPETHVWSPSSSAVSLSMSGTPLCMRPGRCSPLLACGAERSLGYAGPTAAPSTPERFSRWFEQHARDGRAPQDPAPTFATATHPPRWQPASRPRWSASGCGMPTSPSRWIPKATCCPAWTPKQPTRWRG
jgi:hypothetical protein